MTSPAKPIAAVLHDSPEASHLIARWEATQRAVHCIDPVCRSLASGFDPLESGRCELRDDVLRLTASSAAQGAKLRQAIPRLLLALGSEALRVYEIRIRVEPGISGYPEQGSMTPSSTDAPWLKPSREAAVHVGEFALTVRESPLKKAIGKLAATLRKRAQR